jgi:hypothetical protein
MIKSRRMTSEGRVAPVRREEMLAKFWMGSPEGRDHSEELCIGREIILKVILWEIGLECVDLTHVAQDTGS